MRSQGMTVDTGAATAATGGLVPAHDLAADPAPRGKLGWPMRSQGRVQEAIGMPCRVSRSRQSRSHSSASVRASTLASALRGESPGPWPIVTA